MKYSGINDEYKDTYIITFKICNRKLEQFEVFDIKKEKR